MRKSIHPLVATILGTLWLLIVVAGYLIIGLLFDNGTGAWWGFGIFLMVGLAFAPFAIYAVVES